MLDIVLNPFWAWTLAGEVPDGNAVRRLIICGAVALSLIAENARRRR